MSTTTWQRHFWVLFALLVAASSRLVAQEPDKDALGRAAEETLQRLPRRNASWTAVTRLPNEVRVEIEVLSTPSMRRKGLKVFRGERRVGDFHVIERDGCWYVVEQQQNSKYRPFEALFEFDVTYLFLARAELNLAIRDYVDTIGQHTETNDGIATFVVPPDDSQRRQIEYAISQAEELWQRQPKAKTPEAVKTIEKLRALLPGTPMRIDVATGIVVQYGVAERQTDIRDFQWLDQVDPESFSVEAKDWDDFSADLTEGDLDELAMIRHNANWRPDLKSSEGETCLVNLRTGQRRRVPFEGIAALAGCFLRDRKHVIVCGMDATSGSLGPYEVNLSTGENRRLGGEPFAVGHALGPVLSPDGKTIAILHKELQGSMLDQQIYLIDLETDRTKPLGKPQDMAFLSWLPDGQHLVVLIRSQPDLLGKQRRSVALMDMKGESTALFEGDMPLLLNDGKTILFRTTDNQGWRTYDLHDQQIRPFADGMTAYGFPTPGPDGKNLLWISWAHGNSPLPEVVPVGENSGKVVTRTPGLWNLPAWR